MNHPSSPHMLRRHRSRPKMLLSCLPVCSRRALVWASPLKGPGCRATHRAAKASRPIRASIPDAPAHAQHACTTNGADAALVPGAAIRRAVLLFRARNLHPRPANTSPVAITTPRRHPLSPWGACPPYPNLPDVKIYSSCVNAGFRVIINTSVTPGSTGSIAA